MTRAIQIRAPGGPDRFERIELSLPRPGDGEIRVRHTAIGVSFIDIYQRAGTYPVAMPAVLGIEAAGVVEALGAGVHDVAIGDRVVYAGSIGAYSEARNLAAWRAIAIPTDVDDRVAASLLARGITAHMLQDKVFALGAGMTALVHSAAGGLGSLLVQWGKLRGATVIATVGSTTKAAVARDAGADHVLVGRGVDFATQVRALTNGVGVDVAYDGVGGSTLANTLACVRPFGTVVSFGQAAGPIPPIPVEAIGPARSLALARPSVMQYMADRTTYRRAALAVIESGLRPATGRAFPLGEVARAHAELGAGATTGSVTLIP